MQLYDAKFDLDFFLLKMISPCDVFGPKNLTLAI